MLESLHFFPIVSAKHDQNIDRGCKLKLTSFHNYCFREEIRQIKYIPVNASLTI